ncbi:MAG: hypothetical protein R6U98_11930 [Pirellulaceae bacterium]
MLRQWVARDSSQQRKIPSGKPGTLTAVDVAPDRNGAVTSTVSRA